MKLHSLCVENYRNIRAARFTPGEELTVLCGENGQGKTNLLEAVWLLTGSKSFRNAKDAQLIRQGEEFAVVQGSAECGGMEKDIRITVAGDICEKKRPPGQSKRRGVCPRRLHCRNVYGRCV